MGNRVLQFLARKGKEEGVPVSILFVLLTFLLILTVMYFRRPQQAQELLQAAGSRGLSVARSVNLGEFQVPEGYSFHPGHTWLADEGRQNARVGIDTFAANLLGKVDSVEIAELNRWVRQGQRLCTLTHGGREVQLLSPVEGVVVSINHEVLKDPNLVVEEPYSNGWLCVIKAPELAINAKNLLHGPLVPAWIQNSYARMGNMLQQLTPALAQDGGLPVRGLLFKVDLDVQHHLTREFFLT